MPERRYQRKNDDFDFKTKATHVGLMNNIPTMQFQFRIAITLSSTEMAIPLNSQSMQDGVILFNMPCCQFSDCKGVLSLEPDLTCSHRTLTVLWLTNTTFTADITKIPAQLRRRLTDRLNTAPVFKLVVVNAIPP